MNKELKRTILDICRNYNVNYEPTAQRYYISGVMKITMQAKYSLTQTSNIDKVQLILTIEDTDSTPVYSNIATIESYEVNMMKIGLNRLSASKQDLMDIFNAMTASVREQQRTKMAADRNSMETNKNLRLLYPNAQKTNTGR